MKRLALSLLLAFAPALASATPPDRAPFQDQYPIPGARYVSPETDIMLRPGGAVALGASSGDEILDVRGSVSGPRRGRLTVAEDGETILFDPDGSFVSGETVQVRVRPGLRTSLGDVPPTRFSFTVSEGRGAAPPSAMSSLELSYLAPPGLMSSGLASSHAAPSSLAPSAASDSLPADFPRLTRTVTGPSSPGRLFLSNLSFGPSSYAPYLMIVDDDGTPLFQRRLAGVGLDFKLQPDGRATYFDNSKGRYYALDATLAVVDSFACGNGYATDMHDLQVLPNGHALLLSYDPQQVDMSQIVPGGIPRATVTGLVIQEIDREKRVVFQWRSWDHFQILDATDRDFTATFIDYVHGNSVERDSDGNLIISSRHMDEITKISRRNGKIIWRLGGKNNEFTFEGDPIGFSHQHDARRLSNGNLMLFDNGFYHDPPFSRVVEYRLDEARKRATLVWEYRPTPSIIAWAMGSAQRLPNGNTLVGWGSANPTVTEVNPAGEKVTEVTFPTGIVSYRAFRFDWPPVLAADVRLEPAAIPETSRIPWIHAWIRVPNVFPSQVDPASVLLGGIAAAVEPEDEIGSAGGGPGDALRLRFSRADLVATLSPGGNRLELTGRLRTGVEFRGEAELSYMNRERSDRVSLVGNRTGGTAPIELYLNGGSAGDYEVAVFDVRGALVRTWTARLSEETPVRWTGDFAGGRPASSGVYFVRVERGTTRALAKVVIVR